MMETEMLQNNTTHYKLIRMKHPRRMSRKTSLVHMQTHMRKKRFEQTPFALSLSLYNTRYTDDMVTDTHHNLLQ